MIYLWSFPVGVVVRLRNCLLKQHVSCILLSPNHIFTSDVFTSGTFKWSLVTLAGLVVYGIILRFFRLTLLTWLVS